MTESKIDLSFFPFSSHFPLFPKFTPKVLLITEYSIFTSCVLKFVYKNKIKTFTYKDTLDCQKGIYNVLTKKVNRIFSKEKDNMLLKSILIWCFLLSDR